MANVGSVRIVKRPPPANVQFKNIQQEIIKQLKPVGQHHVDERAKIVVNFETEIKFGYRISATEAQITLSVVVENSDTKLKDSDWTVGELWRALDKKGTPSHPIRPKTLGPAFGGALKFVWGGPGSYSPKTRPGGRYGGPGTVRGGQPTFRTQVQHPGFHARKFSDKINKRLDKQFRDAISRGVRIGSKKRR